MGWKSAEPVDALIRCIRIERIKYTLEETVTLILEGGEEYTPHLQWWLANAKYICAQLNAGDELYLVHVRSRAYVFSKDTLNVFFDLEDLP